MKNNLPITQQFKIGNQVVTFMLNKNAYMPEYNVKRDVFNESITSKFGLESIPNKVEKLASDACDILGIDILGINEGYTLPVCSTSTAYVNDNNMITEREIYNELNGSNDENSKNLLRDFSLAYMTLKDLIALGVHKQSDVSTDESVTQVVSILGNDIIFTKRNGSHYITSLDLRDIIVNEIGIDISNNRLKILNREHLELSGHNDKGINVDYSDEYKSVLLNERDVYLILSYLNRYNLFKVVSNSFISKIQE